MQAEHNPNIVRTIFNKEHISDVTVDELLIAAAKYPYSSLLQLFYSKTLKERNDSRYPASVAKTALYFSNPHWLHHQLQDKVDVFASLITGPAKYILQEEAPVLTEENEQPVQPEEKDEAVLTDIEEEAIAAELHPQQELQLNEIVTKEEPEPIVKKPISAEELNIEETGDVLQTDLQLNEPDEIPVMEEESTEAVVLAVEESALSDTESVFSASQEEPEEDITADTIIEEPASVMAVTEPQAAEEITLEKSDENLSVPEIDSFPPEVPESMEEIPIYPEFDEYDQALSNPPDENLLIEAALTESYTETENINEISEERMEVKEEISEPAELPAEVTEDHITEEYSTSDSRVSQPVDESETGQIVLEEEREELVAEKETIDVPEQVIPFTETEKSDVQQDSPALSFEPFHTIDYFASQGIKLTADDENKDQLTHKLKSFTEWLRAMKKIHPEKLKNELDEKTELNIKTVAEHSNDQGEILTETMAEILHKQGLIDKALEVYEKLSLLNPSKSDYFAAKISALKAIGI